MMNLQTYKELQHRQQPVELQQQADQRVADRQVGLHDRENEIYCDYGLPLFQLLQKVIKSMKSVKDKCNDPQLHLPPPLQRPKMKFLMKFLETDGSWEKKARESWTVAYLRRIYCITQAMPACEHIIRLYILFVHLLLVPVLVRPAGSRL
jgi:hypothetical protein